MEMSQEILQRYFLDMSFKNTDSGLQWKGNECVYKPSPSNILTGVSTL